MGAGVGMGMGMEAIEMCEKGWRRRFRWGS
jgi:hypothetical protein